MAAKPKGQNYRRARPDKRKSLLVYLDPEVIKKLKIEALNQNRPAYELVEEAVSLWLRTRKGR
jgi:hypothetical protein